MSKRRYPRVHIHRSIAYQGSCGTGHETVHDFSPSGCRIHEADAKVHCGLRLTLWISLPDRIEPIEIKPAVVTWTQKDTFGVEFIAPSHEIRTRMKTGVRSPPGCSDSGGQGPDHFPPPLLEISVVEITPDTITFL
ncbi:MAG: PilZ domain-containing protein, partial [Nitrospira sp.]|nr:PilZ domain-containing protein [Nitrospira sp.]